jgi:hypothetical protein
MPVFDQFLFSHSFSTTVALTAMRRAEKVQFNDTGACKHSSAYPGDISAVRNQARPALICIHVVQGNRLIHHPPQHSVAPALLLSIWDARQFVRDYIH